MKVICECGITEESKNFYKTVKDQFEEFVSAEMVGDNDTGKYKLILTDKNKNILIFDGGLTSGYFGEGCHGTLDVLKDAGFNVDSEYIGKNEIFKINK